MPHIVYQQIQGHRPYTSAGKILLAISLVMLLTTACAKSSTPHQKPQIKVQGQTDVTISRSSGP